MTELIELIKHYMKIRTPLMNVPTDSADKSAKVFSKLLKNVHSDLIGLMTADSACSDAEQDLPVALSEKTLEESLPQIIQKL